MSCETARIAFGSMCERKGRYTHRTTIKADPALLFGLINKALPIHDFSNPVHHKIASNRHITVCVVVQKAIGRHSSTSGGSTIPALSIRASCYHTDAA